MEKNKEISLTSKNKGGRPSKYTKEIGDRVCALVATSTVGLYTLCEHTKDLPAASTIRLWRLCIAEFSAQYARAKLVQADILAEDCLDISDSATSETINVDRERINTRKWLASKLLPKLYGDRALLEQKEEENEQLKEELRTLRTRLDESHRRDF